MMINPPIKWMGGKSRLREKVISEFCPHTCYVEVFGGAGWVLFGKQPSSVEVYNDINRELVNFFRVAKNRTTDLIEALDLVPASREIFQDWKNVDLDSIDEVTRAARFYYLLFNGFGGKFSGTKPASNFGYSSVQASSYNPDRIPPDIRQTYERLKRVYIENLDFEALIKAYDSPDTLFFCDPPYAGLTGYGGDGFTDDDQRRLGDVLKAIKGKFILTNSDHPLIREIYDGCNFQVVELIYSVGANKDEEGKAMRSNKVAQEVIVTNYRRQATLFDCLPIL